MDAQSERLEEILSRVRMYKEEPNKVEECNNSDEKYTRRNQWQNK